MASRTPSIEPADGTALEQYLRGWAAITELIGGGSPWSGHERNNAYLNLSDGRFADVAFVSGLDFVDDGRAVAATDWDGDGDLDLWLRNRSGPQLRLMLHEGAPAGHFVAFLLEGVAANRDAVGARIVVDASGRRFVREVRAGDGYLAQSSRWQHLGLGDARRVDRLEVRWPGGDRDVYAGLAVDRRYRLRQGERPRAVEPRAVTLPPPAPPLDESDAGVRVLLKEPLPLPPSIAHHAARHEATLVNLWASWCAPCRDELEGFVAAGGAFGAAGLAVRALSVDAPEEASAADALLASIVGNREPLASGWLDPGTRETLDTILRHVLRRHDALTLPTSLLVDAQGRLQLIYLGPVTPERLLADHARFVLQSPRPERRSLSHGRWYFRTPRDFTGLAAELRRQKREEAARFYETIARLPRPSAGAPGPTR